MKVLHLKIASLVVLIVVLAGCSGSEDCFDRLGPKYCCNDEPFANENKDDARCVEYLNTPTLTVNATKVKSVADVQETSVVAKLLIANYTANSQTIAALSHYIDMPSNDNQTLTRGIDGSSSNKSIYQLASEQLPTDISMLYRETVVVNADGSTQTQDVFLTDELADVLYDAAEATRGLIPDYSAALSLDFVEEIAESKLFVQNTEINPRTLDGAIAVRFLNGYANSESFAVTEAKLRQEILATYPDATITEVSASDSLTRGFHNECSVASFFNIGISLDIEAGKAAKCSKYGDNYYTTADNYGDNNKLTATSAVNVLTFKKLEVCIRWCIQIPVLDEIAFRKNKGQ